MSEKIVQLNEEVIKGQIKELVRGSVEKNESIFAEASAPTAIRHASPKLVANSPIKMYGIFSKRSFLMSSCFFIVPAPSACSGPRRRVSPAL